MGLLKRLGTNAVSVGVAGSMLVAVSLAGLQSCSNEQIVGDGTGVDAGALEGEEFFLAQIVGESISFKGEFTGPVSDSIFRVEAVDQEAKGLEELDGILVLNSSDQSFRVPAGEETPIWILGEVRTLTAEDLESNSVPPEQQAELEGEAVVVAESVTLAPEPEELVENAEAFLNQEVTVFGNVELTDNPDTFVVENPGLFQGKGVVVIEGEGADLFKAVDNQRTAVSGVLRSYVIADLEKEYGLVWDLSLREKIEAEFQQSPVVIATGVYPVGEDLADEEPEEQ